MNQNLRSFGSLSRNDVQCMMYNQSDGLPGTISNGLNTKVDQLLKVRGGGGGGGRRKGSRLNVKVGKRSVGSM